MECSDFLSSKIGVILGAAAGIIVLISIMSRSSNKYVYVLVTNFVSYLYCYSYSLLIFFAGYTEIVMKIANDVSD